MAKDSLLALHEAHRSNVEDIVFSTPKGTYPAWLRAQGHACSERYGHFHVIPEFQAAIAGFDQEASTPFELFVVGEGKFGKSTLVNALLGEQRSKARGLPETRCFLRYVISEEPSSNARLFLRLEPGIHAWLTNQLGPGRTVHELYEIRQYDIPAEAARSLLEEEARRLDAGNYVPAIFEIERDVARSRRGSFPSGIRIVDTQGLDQLFPNDLQNLSRSLGEKDATERFLAWMSTTPRGKHLEWQFRRCDSVLWCISAKRIGSAATEASLRHFAGYAKKIVIALTSVDLVAKCLADRERLLQHAQQKYGMYARAIFLINGEQALQGTLAGDDARVAESGLPELVAGLTRICVSQASKTRTVSRYIALRKTEGQFRNALFQMAKELVAIDRKGKADRKAFDKAVEDSWDRFFQWLGPRVQAAVGPVFDAVEKIELSDDRHSAIDKLEISSFTSNLEAQVDSELRNNLVPAVRKFAQGLKPYRLPAFDAEGMVAEDKLSFEVEITRPHVPAIRLDFSLQLEDEMLTRARLWLKENVAGFFSAEARAEAVREREWLSVQRWKYVAEAFASQWNACCSAWVKSLGGVVVGVYDPVSQRLEAILEAIEAIQEEPIPVTIAAIDDALAGMASRPALYERFVAVMKHCSS